MGPSRFGRPVRAGCVAGRSRGVKPRPHRAPLFRPRFHPGTPRLRPRPITSTPQDHPQPHEAEPSARLAGLAPEDASDWLELQTVHAWAPETIAPHLRAGTGPEALLQRLEVAPLFTPPAEALARREAEREARRARLAGLGVRVVPLTHPDYPEPLRALEDAPLVLAVRGRAEVLASSAIAIVGARAATRSARAIARRLGHDLAAAGFTIVSGLARGIDGEAHRGALEAGGRTIGVLACGIDQVYPPEHRRLAEEMVVSGAVVSELPLGALPRPLNFPLRNRIISGLSCGVIVVEARQRSGSLITVRHALAQGREVFVVPGSVDGPYAEGTNQLLREGARAIQSARHVLEDLGVDPGEVRARPEARVAVEREFRGPVAARLLSILADGPCTRDGLFQAAGRDSGLVATVLLELELAGRIVEERDGRIRFVPGVPTGSERGLG